MDKETRGTITVPLDVVRALFDTAVGSMDFGSGFLDNDEVEKLRETAKLLGLDPMLGTPREFRATYSHKYQPRELTDWLTKKPYWICDWCDKPKGHKVHHGKGKD